MKKYGNYLIWIIGGLFITYGVVRWLIPLFFSCLIVLVLEPLLQKEIDLFKLKQTFLIKLLIVVNYFLWLAFIIGMIIFSVIQIYQVLELLPEYIIYLYQSLSSNHYIIDASKYLDIVYSGSMSIIESISRDFITGLLNFIMQIPSVLFDLMFVIITSLFMLLDYHQLTTLFEKYPIVAFFIDAIKEGLSNLFKAYFILMIFTFVILFGCFSILGLKQSLMLASFIAIFDFLPVLGLDMIMIPWIIVAAITNEMKLALGLLTGYIVVVVVKNFLEPKLLAKNIGVSPLVSLIGMYLGMKIFGFVGLLVVPIALMIVIQIIKAKRVQKL